MKTYRPLLGLLAIAALFCSCSWGVPKESKAEVSKDTVLYTIENYNRRDPDCGNKPDSTCPAVKIQYPVFKDQQVLNDTIVAKLAIYPGTPTIDAIGKRFFSVCQTTKQSAEKDGNKLNAKQQLVETAIVARQDSGLIGVQIDAHVSGDRNYSNATTSFINWDVKQKKNLKLTDILTEDYNTPLNKVAEKIFRKEENLTDTSSLKRDYFFPNSVFRLNNNFLITPVGLRFVYNVGEIKPKAAGQTEVLVPYDQIKTLLKPNSVVSQYVK